MKGLILAPLQEVGIGQELESYPSHITIVPPFSLHDDKLDALRERLHDVAKDWLPIDLYVGDFADYDQKEDIKVRKLYGRVFGVHAGAIAAVKYLGGSYPEERTGVWGWNPHVSKFEDLQKGDRLKLGSFVLIQTFKDKGSQKKIVTDIFDGKTHETTA